MIGAAHRDDGGGTAVEPTRYEVDAGGRISSVSGGWEDFARANGAPHLAGGAVLGRPLLGFVTEPTTAHLYARILDRVRRGARVVLPFRCDGPSVRRSMELVLSPLPGGAVRFEASLLAAEARPPVPLLDLAVPRDDGLVKMCAWCRRMPLGEAWVEVEVGVAALRLFETAAVPRISHGICPDCVRAVTAQAR